MQNNVQDLIANLANTVSTDEIKQTKVVATKVRSMYTENGENTVVNLVMIAHDLEAEMF
ncbi:hypothetical protein [Planktothricoides raciborskii]|nr:hypothetical protein [Planktothricoides raciborskii]